MEEKELVKAAQGGDFEAFSRLIAGHKDKIYRLALRLTGNREDAEDIVQETFLKAVDNIDRFRMESSFGTWLYSIALNQIRAEAASQKRMELKPVEDYLPVSHEDKMTGLFDWGDPHRQFESSQIQGIIENTLEQMDPKYSLPFVLRYMEEMSVKEVAAILKLSVAATKSRILRARLALRDKLDSMFQEKSHERLQ